MVPKPRGIQFRRDCIPIETTASSADEYACPSGSAFRTRVVGPLRHKREHCEERALRPFRCLHFPASQLASLAWDEASLHLKAHEYSHLLLESGTRGAQEGHWDVISSDCYLRCGCGGVSAGPPADETHKRPTRDGAAQHLRRGSALI